MANEETGVDILEETETDLEIIYTQGFPIVKGPDGKLYGMFTITRPEDIENLYNYLENFNSDSGVTTHIADKTIHTSTEEKEAWEAGVVSATSALEQATTLSARLEELQGLVEKLEESVESNITSNPFSVTAENLDGITLAKGIWNESKGRIEC